MRILIGFLLKFVEQKFLQVSLVWLLLLLVGKSLMQKIRSASECIYVAYITFLALEVELYRFNAE